MGIASSSSVSAPGEGEHYVQLVNPQRSRPVSAVVSGAETGKKVSAQLGINPRARLLRRVRHEALWEAFLSSSFPSFALTPAELHALLTEACASLSLSPAVSVSVSASAAGNKSKAVKIEQAVIDAEIADYLQLQQELEPHKALDMMSVVSAALLLSPQLLLEHKVDALFAWIALAPGEESFCLEDFSVALASFERGVANAFGRPAASEGFVTSTAKSWLDLASPETRLKSGKTLSRAQFFEFCTNRQHVVRRLLEALVALPVIENENQELQEIDTVKVEERITAPQGDEWMANPAWKKTAERMIPPALRGKASLSAPPQSSLSLDWVHGYRGFDCRNNVFFLDAQHVIFPAAALTVAQHVRERRQTFFGEHRDDVLCLSVWSPALSNNGRRDANGQETTLVASGEIGKSPAIYLYSFSSVLGNNTETVAPSSNTPSGRFQCLACLQGAHAKGVGQLVFSPDGRLLFSVGIEYSVAIYAVDASDSTRFGKMLVSAQGPKEKLLHCAAVSANVFVTCGEKHAIRWTFVREQNLLRKEDVKLGSFRNKIFLCVTSLGDNDLENNVNKANNSNSSNSPLLLASSEGDLLFCRGGKAGEKGGEVATAVQVGKTNSAFTGHGKCAINALWRCETRPLLVSGDKEGKVVLWRCSQSEGRLSLLWEFTLTGFLRSLPLEGIISTAPQPATPTPQTATSSPTAVSTTTDKPPAVRALCVHHDSHTLIVGTHRCELIHYELPASLFDDTALVDSGSLSSSALRAEMLVSGHFLHEVWGLAVRPVTAHNAQEGVQYATVGDDGFLRLWSLEKRCLLACVDLQGVARCVEYSPDGLYLAVGFGAGNTVSSASASGAAAGKKRSGKNKEDGMVKVIRIDDEADGGKDSVVFTQVAEIREAKQWISVVRFSPDGTLLAVGSRDNSIYLYSVPNQFKRKLKLSKHNAGITHLDFSSCGMYLQSCCSAYEILFYNVQTGAQVTNGASQLMDIEWFSWTCSLGWPVIGIWSGSMDGSDINAVARSPSHKYLATCDDFGKVNIFNYPSIQEKGALHNSYTGHSSHVTCVRWASLPPKRRGGKAAKTGPFTVPRSDDYLLSVGGQDKCLLQWKHTEPRGTGVSTTERDGEEEADRETLERPKASSSEAEDLWAALPQGGDEFLAVKPWLGAIVAPTAWARKDPAKLPPFFSALSDYARAHNALTQQLDDLAEGEASSASALTATKSSYDSLRSACESVQRAMQQSGYTDSAAPTNDDLELCWVHGYRGFELGAYIFYTPTTRDRLVLYAAAALVIVANPVKKTQRYFRGHTDDVVALTVMRDVRARQETSWLVASAQCGPAKLFVWSVPDMQTLASLSLPNKQKNITHLAFSPDGRLLVSLTEDRTLTVCDWQSASFLATTSMDKSAVFALAVAPSSSSAKSNTATLQFLSVGDKAMRFWTLNGRNVSSAQVRSKSPAKMQKFLCVTQLFGRFFIGCEDGDVYILPAEATSAQTVLSLPANNGAKTAAKGKKATDSVTACTSLHVENLSLSLFVCGTKSGRIVFFDASSASSVPVPLFAFNVSELGVDNLLAKQIQSLALLHDSSRERSLFVAIGTRGCDLLECTLDLNTRTMALNKENSSCEGIITRGHCNDELWGVACHPFKPEFCSVGDDKTLRFFDLRTHKMTHLVPLGFLSRTICYSSDGSLLALGCGGRVGRGKENGDGVVRVYALSETSEGAKECVKLAERQDAKQWISDVKFSADGRLLAAAAHDCKIYLYNVQYTPSSGGVVKKCELQLRSVFSKHNSVVTHVDISLDGRYLQSNCAAYELLFCDIETGRQITAASELRDVQWKTWTCPLGWPVQGIWRGGIDGSDINAVARSNSGHLLAVGDDFGRVSLYRYPCIRAGADQCLSFPGHSSHVMNVRWSSGDECLVSAGGNDKCLLLWRHRVTDVSLSGGGANDALQDMTLSSGNNDKKTRFAVDGTSSSTSSRTHIPGVDGDDKDDDDEDMFAEAHGGDESLCVRPWLAAVRAPRYPPPVSPAAPAVRPRLQWVHGYTCSQRRNVFFTANQKVLYPAAALAVMLERDRAEGEVSQERDDSRKNPTITTQNSSAQDWKQEHLMHEEDVLCVTVSRCRRFCATGQIASKSLKGRASVTVWDTTQARELSCMRGCHARGVLCLAFNDSGDRLVSVGADDSHSHIVWKDLGGSWSRVQSLATAPGDKQVPYFVRWLGPQHPLAQSGECHLLSGGGRALSLWRMEGAALSKKQARLGKRMQRSGEALLSVACLDELCVVGTAQGDVLCLRGNERELALFHEKAHSTAILSLCALRERALLVSGDKDGTVKIWSISATVLQETCSFSRNQFVDLLAQSSSPRITLTQRARDKAVIALDVYSAGPQTSDLSLAVGTSGGDVFELSVPPLHSSSSGSREKEKETISFDFSHATVCRVACSHTQGELWGVAVHPTERDLVATVGDDATLRVWSIRRNLCLCTQPLPRGSRSLAWHPDGHVLAVGLTAAEKTKKRRAQTKETKKGTKATNADKSKEKDEDEDENNDFSASSKMDKEVERDTPHAVLLFAVGVTLSPLSISIKRSADGCGVGKTSSVSAMAFSAIEASPETEELQEQGNTLCVARETRIYGYRLPYFATDPLADQFPWTEVEKTLQGPPLFVFDKHAARVIQLDLSLDGKYMQSVDVANELLFFDLERRVHEPSASKVADYNGALSPDDNAEEAAPRQWASQTCVFGWAVQGIWPPNAYDSSEINAVDRSLSSKFIATSEDSGKVRVLRYPCVQPGSAAVTLQGHSSHVTCVRWSTQHLLSVGGNDKCLMVWEVNEE